jgi:hypothetical protein
MTTTTLLFLLTFYCFFNIPRNSLAFSLLLLELYLLIFIQTLQENAISEKVIIFYHLDDNCSTFLYDAHLIYANGLVIYVCWSYPTVEFFKGDKVKRHGRRPYLQITSYNVKQTE